MYSDFFYSLTAKFYNLGLKLNGYRKAADFFIKQIPISNEKSLEILDAGCGTGLYTFAALKKWPQTKITAIDINPAMLYQLKLSAEKNKLTNIIKIVHTDISQPISELNNQQFDLIITGGVLEHALLERTVRNLSIYLKTGGYFFNSPVKNNILGKIIGTLSDFHPYSKNKNLETFLENNYALVEIIDLPTKYFFINLVKEGHLFKKIS